MDETTGAIKRAARYRAAREQDVDALVELVVDRILEVVGHLADPTGAPAVPGTWCSHCHLRSSCPEGATFLERRAAAQRS